MKSFLIAGAVLMSTTAQSCLAAPTKEKSLPSKMSYAKENGRDDASVTEIKLVDNNQTIILQSEGTAIRYDLGSSSAWKKSDPKKANYRQGVVNPNDYAMLVKVINKEKFFAMKDFLPGIYSGIDFATSVKKNGKTHEVRRMSYEEAEFRQPVGEGPLALWTIEKAIYGVSSSIRWEKDSNLVRVRGIVRIKATLRKGPATEKRVWVVAQSAKNAGFKRNAYARADGTFQLLLPVGDYKLIARQYKPSTSTGWRSAEQLVSVKASANPRLSFSIDTTAPTIQ